MAELKEHGWANTLVIDERFAATEFTLFGIDIELTEEGLQLLDDVIHVVFGAIGVIRQAKRQLLEENWFEYEKLRKLAFKYTVGLNR